MVCSVIETFAALLFAHTLADFAFQTNWMVQNKRQILPMLAHIVVVLATAIVATGTLHLVIFVLAAVHMAIDAVKITYFQNRLRPFLTDQTAHLASIIAIATLQPDLWATGVWANFPWLASVMTVTAGLLLVTQAGGYAVGMLMQPWADDTPTGLRNGGRVIGTLERGLIYLLILTGQAAGIGFLIAAKSVLRFGAVKDEGKLSEYVIIGTLASFGWAIIVSAAVVALLSLLPSLGIPDLLP
jgi:Protein of unknown function (DUF3307)